MEGCVFRQGEKEGGVLVLKKGGGMRWSAWAMRGGRMDCAWHRGAEE